MTQVCLHQVKCLSQSEMLIDGATIARDACLVGPSSDVTTQATAAHFCVSWIRLHPNCIDLCIAGIQIRVQNGLKVYYFGPCAQVGTVDYNTPIGKTVRSRACMVDHDICS